MAVSVALFTRDLRVHDNPVLVEAAADADHVIPLYVLDERLVATGFANPNRAAFLADSLHDLHASLQARGAALVVRRGAPESVVPELLRQHEMVRVHVAADSSAFAHGREQRLRHVVGDRLVVHHDVHRAVASSALQSDPAHHDEVFTPYFQKWSRIPPRPPLPAPTGLRLPPLDVGVLPEAEEFCPGEPVEGLPAGGETAGRERLRSWLGGGMNGFAEQSAGLLTRTTSRLSPYLHFGCLSGAEVRCATGDTTEDARKFARQLAWRDFYDQVLAARPEAAWEDYRGQGDRWRDAPGELLAWQEGRTGYPVVDAAQRQLVAEGWLSNRARLLAASFLCKTLYLDWRPGARFFLRHLVDGDLAANQLNWQWMAGTGTDTRPDRVMDPLWQAENHDPDGDFVRRYVPELRSVAGPAVHRPWDLDPVVREGLGYPAPIVDLREAHARFSGARRELRSRRG
ncbi:deoxyribodipyrimidine photo-lyase [Lentzea sp. CC55]|uniref:cryptochrome/photolyase family protein n=1 Tax=Lentzea sp. CC55 TaxID=2884909 RepID=UPI001F427651|nr:deoxyribodipyrimidine photo-lyase [Lentzea sp. CC55]MCG8927785.1 DNA photolyase family protein [Lentzea sp. CC55]